MTTTTTKKLGRPKELGLLPPSKTGRPRTRYPEERCAVLTYGPAVSTMIEAVATGYAREVACYGTRGDGKTIGALGAMLEHARLHQAAGFPLPTSWMGVTDTLASHKLKTVRSAQDPLWKGAWQVHDGGHVLQAVVNRQVAVHLDLFGIEDQGAMDRVRMEVHGVWFEEPAPSAVLVKSEGVDETAWSIALTSQRKGTTRGPHGEDRPGSHCYPALMTLNYPDEDHWTWQRFRPSAGPVGLHPDDPTRLWVRIPPGERASAAQRREWAHALRDRPDILRRLIEGQPGTILLGKQVADGFREDLHVSTERLDPIPNEPLLCGLDFGHTPTLIIGQAWRGERRVLAAFTTTRGGVRQLLENDVLPWLASRAPWARQPHMLVGCYDVAGQTDEQTDIERDPISLVETMLGGLWFPGPIAWPARQHVLVSAMNHHKQAGQVSLRIDPVGAALLVKALSGRWHYAQDRQGQLRRDLPKKPNHPWEDLGDAFIYWLWGLTSEAPPSRPEVRVETSFRIGAPAYDWLGDRAPEVVTRW